MSVSPIGSAGFSTLQQSPSSQGNWQSVLNSAAGTLGLSTTALQQQLQLRSESGLDRAGQRRFPADARAVDFECADAERLDRIERTTSADRDEHREPHARHWQPPSPPWRRRHEPAVL